MSWACNWGHKENREQVEEADDSFLLENATETETNLTKSIHISVHGFKHLKTEYE